jgi:hypothetical protein
MRYVYRQKDKGCPAIMRPGLSLFAFKTVGSAIAKGREINYAISSLVVIACEKAAEVRPLL